MVPVAGRTLTAAAVLTLGTSAGLFGPPIASRLPADLQSHAVLSVCAATNDGRGTRAGEHPARGLHRIGREDVRRVCAYGSATAVRPRDHEQRYAVPAFETRRRKQLTEQRMHRRGHLHPARQHRTQMLQSLAITSGTGKTHLLVALGIAAVDAGHKVRYFTAAELNETLYRASRQLRRARDREPTAQGPRARR